MITDVQKWLDTEHPDQLFGLGDREPGISWLGIWEPGDFDDAELRALLNAASVRGSFRYSKREGEVRQGGEGRPAEPINGS
jgi:hypothetical protein